MKRLVILIGAWCAGVVVFLVLLFTVVERFYKSPDPPRYTVQGTVVDRDTGAPIADASLVCVSGYPLSFFEQRDEVKTDAQGRYTLPIQYKDWFIEVHKRGYERKKVYWVPPDEIPSWTRIIRLSRTGSRFQ